MVFEFLAVCGAAERRSPCEMFTFLMWARVYNLKSTALLSLFVDVLIVIFCEKKYRCPLYLICLVSCVIFPSFTFRRVSIAPPPSWREGAFFRRGIFLKTHWPPPALKSWGTKLKSSCSKLENQRLAKMPPPRQQILPRVKTLAQEIYSTPHILSDHSLRI